MMIYICVVCMAKQPPLLFLSPEQRQILEAILSPPLNTAELRTRQLLLCACCMHQLQSLLEFRKTALEGAKKLLSLYNLIEQNDLQEITSFRSTLYNHLRMSSCHCHPAPKLVKIRPAVSADEMTMEIMANRWRQTSIEPRAYTKQRTTLHQGTNAIRVSVKQEPIENVQENMPPIDKKLIPTEELAVKFEPESDDERAGATVHNVPVVGSTAERVHILTTTPTASSDVTVEIMTHETMPQLSLVHKTTPATKSVGPASSSVVKQSQKRKKTPAILKSNDKTRVVCKECNKTLSNSTNLKGHYARAHTQPVPTKCDICDFVCKNEPAMKHHKKYVHKVKEPRTIDNLRLDLFCAECQIQCPSRAAYRDHMLSLKHTPRDKWSFECDMCNRRFPNKRRLQFHKDSVHLDKKKHKCDKCNNSYATRCGLRLHISTVHDKVPPRKTHICHLCGDCFSTKAMLAGHINTHTGDRPYVCNLCGDTFGHKSALYLHGRFKHKIPRKKDIKKTDGSKNNENTKKTKKTKKTKEREDNKDSCDT